MGKIKYNYIYIYTVYIYIYTWKTIAIFFVKTHVSSFSVDYGFLPNTVFFQHTGTFFFQQHVEKIRVYYGLAPLRTSNTNPNTHMVIFLDITGFTHNRQKKCQYGFSGIYYIHNIHIYPCTAQQLPLHEYMSSNSNEPTPTTPLKVLIPCPFFQAALVKVFMAGFSPHCCS